MIGSQRSYVNNVAGQLHVWHWQGTAHASPPLICLPPVPYGGRFFHTFASALGGRVWSADLPGYGCSDALADLPTVSGYTEAMAPLLQLVTQPVCLLGFHSGTLVAIEMANRYPEQISGLVLVDVPVFSSPDLAKVSASLTDPPDYPQQKDPLNRLFQSMVMDRLDKVPYERALTLFFDFLGSGERRNAGFHAATSYDVQGPAERVSQPTLVIATNSSLRDGTLQAASWIPTANVVERADITMPAFELGADALAQLAREFMG